jgi:hypothetical protein
MTSKTSKQAVEVETRRERILRLRLAGANIRQIASEVGLSLAVVHKHLTAGLEAARRENLDLALEVFATEAARLDALTAAVWEQAQAGNLPAIDRVLAIHDRKCRLFGLTKPPAEVQAAIENTSTGPRAEPDLRRLSTSELVARFKALTAGVE